MISAIRHPQALFEMQDKYNTKLAYHTFLYLCARWVALSPVREESPDRKEQVSAEIAAGRKFWQTVTENYRHFGKGENVG